GVELVPEWAGIAEENLRRARPKLKCPDVQVVRADAAGYAVRADVTFVYFFNPFHGPVLSGALAAIGSSLVQAPRRLWVVFKNTPHLEPALKDHPWLVKQDEFPASDADHKVMILQARMGWGVGSGRATREGQVRRAEPSAAADPARAVASPDL